jgi:GTPase
VNQSLLRLSEGGGEAVYEIGVDDDGTIKGL